MCGPLAVYRQGRLWLMPVNPASAYSPSPTYPLVDLPTLKAILDIDPTDTRKDAQYNLLIPAASKTIKTYTGRDFASPLITEERQYVYNADDGGFLDIDDTAQIISVAYANPYGDDVPVAAEQWIALPPRRDDSPVFTYLAVQGLSDGYRPPSPEMGFTRNLDVLWAEGRIGYGATYMPTFKVTAQWGWPDVPEDVVLAAAWTIQEWVTRPNAEAMTAESIEGYSRSWGRQGVASTGQGIPDRARDILAGYIKVD